MIKCFKKTIIKVGQMKNIEKFLYHAAAYTVAISFLFFIFARIAGIDELSVSFGRYMLIFAFSLIISGSEFIFSLNKIPSALKYVIHYAVLCIGFFFVFLSVQSSSGSSEFTPATVFAGIVLFSFLYFLILLAVFLVKKVKSKAKAKEEPKQKNSKVYTPKFK